MKIDRFETHDRLLQLHKEQSLNLAQGAEDCLKKNDLSLRLQAHSPYIYIFAHPRTADDGVTKRMLWQPRLIKPKAQTNSYLFRATSHTDLLEICWMIPPREMWEQYKKGNITEQDTVRWSILQFQMHRAVLEKVHEDDLPEDRCKWIYQKIAREIDEEKMMKKMYPTQEISGVYGRPSGGHIDL